MIPSSRDLVLGRIRGALASDPRGATPDLALRVAQAPRWTRPAISSDAVQQFSDKARANLSTVQRLSALHDVPSAIEALLSPTGLAREISIAPALRSLPWPDHWTINFGRGRRSETVSVSDALAGVAETGSLVFTSSPDRPTTLNFLPELHVAVLGISRIVANFEDVWPKLRTLEPWPRTVNIISAASRTADVAQIVVRPAHGPKTLHILLVEDA